jgi:hypothetical protein
MLLFFQFEIPLFLMLKYSYLPDTIMLLLLFQARQIVGSAILVKAGDRPEIEDDEFYSLDLVGMRVIVKVHMFLCFIFQVIAASVVYFSKGNLKHITHALSLLIREILACATVSVTILIHVTVTF